MVAKNYLFQLVFGSDAGDAGTILWCNFKHKIPPPPPHRYGAHSGTFDPEVSLVGSRGPMLECTQLESTEISLPVWSLLGKGGGGKLGSAERKVQFTALCSHC